MKRLFLSAVAIFLTIATLAPVAVARQTNLTDLTADLNDDGQVSLTELKFYNRSQRHE